MAECLARCPSVLSSNVDGQTLLSNLATLALASTFILVFISIVS